jgi:predicted glutamine amidotransferase
MTANRTNRMTTAHPVGHDSQVVCRLFGMTGGRERVRATFWLLEAPDSLAVQSRAEPDGAGLGAFSAEGEPVVHRSPLPAYEDETFAAEAREVESRTFVAHVRYGSTGAATVENTHPFEQKDRLFAHSGVVRDLPTLERELGPYRSLVRGDTDSERIFALITREADRNGGDVAEAIVETVRWIARTPPVFALNIVVATPDELWALRYPDTHELFLLERPAGGTHGTRHFEAASAAGRIRVRSAGLASAPAVVVATERMDEHDGWRKLEPGELVHVDADLNVHANVVLDERPAKLLDLQVPPLPVELAVVENRDRAHQ